MTPMLFGSSPSEQPSDGAPIDLPKFSYSSYTHQGATLPALAKEPATVLPSWLVEMADDEETPAVGAAMASPVVAQQGFVLSKMVGRGGMGEVWSALQGTLQRPVAVKRLRHDVYPVGSPNYARAAAEFQLEAMVAGRLEHPNIVPIHDLGADDKGRPLIAMKLVEGSVWSDLLAEDHKRMSAAELVSKHLPTLLAMANAVAFAHDRGVVHRDLKPSQVMVGAFGEVLLMDWGLAIEWKSTSLPGAPRLPLASPPTATNPAGTPAFMAPEQTRDDAGGIGPHTDIFLLGGTLYYLLTGTLPYSAATSQGCFLQARNAMLERPEERTPNRWIPKELADIAMRAMSPKPEDRYATATDFRQAISDWMTGAAQRREAQGLLQDVAAALDANPSRYASFNDVLHLLDRVRGLWPDAPESKELRSRALAGYARAALLAGDLTLARAQADIMSHGAARTSLVDGIDAAMRDVKRRERQRRWLVRATVALVTAVIVGGAAFTWSLNASRAETLIERDRAQAAREDGDQLIWFMLTNLTPVLEDIGRLEIMDIVLEKLHTVVERRYTASPTTQERFSRMMMLREMAAVRGAQGKFAEAEAAARQAMEEGEELLIADPDSEIVLFDVATTYCEAGEVFYDSPLSRRGLDYFARSIELGERLFALPGASPEHRGSLAFWLTIYGEAHRDQGQLEQAEACFDRAAAVLEDVRDEVEHHPEFRTAEANLWRRRGLFQVSLGAYAKAAEYLDRSIALFDVLVERVPLDNTLKLALFGAHLDLVNALVQTAQFDRASGILERADRLLIVQEKNDPTNIDRRNSRALWHYQSSRVDEEYGRLDEAIAHMHASIDIYEKVLTELPGDVERIGEIAEDYLRLASLLHEKGEFAAAEAAADSALEWFARVPGLLPESPEVMQFTDKVAALRAEVLLAMGKPDEAIETMEGVAHRAVNRAEAEPNDTALLDRAAEYTAQFSVLLDRTSRREKERLNNEKRLEISERLVALRPGNVRDLGMLAHVWYNLGFDHQSQGQNDQAREAYAKQREIAERLVAIEPESLIYRESLGLAVNALGSVDESEGNLAAAEASYLEYVKIMEEALAMAPGNARLKRTLGVAKKRLGVAIMKAGRLQEAEPLLRQAVDLVMSSAPADDPARPNIQKALEELEALLADDAAEPQHPKTNDQDATVEGQPPQP